jgi:NAD(P)-dependent dehydrogenase (short-subunit alcohol dehydrogenase family)
MQMTGRVCVVTGSNSGIGKETALALVEMGLTVVMVVRNKEKGQTALDEIVSKTDNQCISLMLCDMSSMISVRRFAEELSIKQQISQKIRFCSTGSSSNIKLLTIFTT